VIARNLAALALAACAALAGAPPVQALGDNDYIGSIELVAFPFCPEGTAELWGSIYPAAQFSALFSLLANRFGGDPAQKNFALPNLHDKAPLDGLRYCMVIDGAFPPRN